MHWFLRVLITGLLYMSFLTTHLSSQATHAPNEYISQNFSQLGFKTGRQKILVSELNSLKGNIKMLTQDAYDANGVFLDHRADLGKSYRYVFDANKNIKEFWLYESHNQPIIKEIYYDFSDQRLKYYMKFAGLRNLELSTTFLYNNRKICIGTKTSEGEHLRKNNFDLLKFGDTTVIVSSRGHELFLSGQLIERATEGFVETELFKYHDNGIIKEWKRLNSEKLMEAMEFDTSGLLVEGQSFMNSDSTLERQSHLVIYSHNDKRQVFKELHRVSDKRIGNYTVLYSYNKNDQLLSKKVVSNTGRNDQFFYKYDQYGNVLEIANMNGDKLFSIEYKRYDEVGNWITKIVRDKSHSLRYERYIEYRNDK